MADEIFGGSPVKTMTELKTLKDFTCTDCCKKCSDRTCTYIGTEQSHSIDTDDLRQEAIKWIKKDIEDYRVANIELPDAPQGTYIHNFIVSQRQKWKDRFNITEEDLL